MDFISFGVGWDDASRKFTVLELRSRRNNQMRTKSGAFDTFHEAYAAANNTYIRHSKQRDDVYLIAKEICCQDLQGSWGMSQAQKEEISAYLKDPQLTVSIKQEQGRGEGNIGTRFEYSDEEERKLRITELEAILDNNPDLSKSELLALKYELQVLRWFHDEPGTTLSSMYQNALNLDLTQFSKEQQEQLQRGLDLDLPVWLYANPMYTPSEMTWYRNMLETSIYALSNPKEHVIATEHGPEAAGEGNAVYGFKSEANFTKHPDTVCYVPENWNFEDGPGYTALDIIELCGGDKLKAEMVFQLCDWQHPSTILSEWDHDDDIALERRRAELYGQAKEAAPSLSERIRKANERREQANTLHINGRNPQQNPYCW